MTPTECPKKRLGDANGHPPIRHNACPGMITGFHLSFFEITARTERASDDSQIPAVNVFSPITIRRR